MKKKKQTFGYIYRGYEIHRPDWGEIGCWRVFEASSEGTLDWVDDSETLKDAVSAIDWIEDNVKRGSEK